MLVDLAPAELETRTVNLHVVMRKAVQTFVDTGAYVAKVKDAKAYEAAHPYVSQQKCREGLNWLKTVNLLSPQ